MASRTVTVRPVVPCPQRCRPASSIPRSASPVCRALPDLAFLADAATKAAPGTVDAPIGVIVGAAIVVTGGMLLLSLGLKPGTDAANQMQERDAKSGRWRK